jgi:hypothetical protein
MGTHRLRGDRRLREQIRTQHKDRTKAWTSEDLKDFLNPPKAKESNPNLPTQAKK